MQIRVATKDDIDELEPFMMLPWVVVPPGEKQPENFDYVAKTFDRGSIIYCAVNDDDVIIGMMAFNPSNRMIEVSAINNGGARVTIKLFNHIKMKHPGDKFYAETYVMHYEMNFMMHNMRFLAKPHMEDINRFSWEMRK